MPQPAKTRKTRAIWLFLLLVAAVMLFFAAYRIYYKAAYPRGFDETVLLHSEKHDLPPALVFAVIRTESGFRPHVESSAGARGIMQITEETFEWVRLRTRKDGDIYADLFDPVRNIEYGTALLRLLLDEFGTVPNALCAYHAGAGSARAWLRSPGISPDGVNITQIPFADTDYYVNRVLETWEIYQALYRIE